MAKLTEEKISEIRDLYAKIGTYSGVAKQIGCAPSTVKKYVTIATDISVNPVEIIHFTDDLKPIEELNFPDKENLIDFLNITKEERKGMEILKKEITRK